MKRAAFTLGLLVVACGHDVPDHDVTITSDCNGPLRSATFHFEAFDFETTCSGGLLDGCTTTEGTGVQRSGELQVTHLRLTGTEESGPMRYELLMPPAGEDAQTFDGTGHHDYVWCGWYVDEALELEEEARQSCYWNTDGCWAELDVRL